MYVEYCGKEVAKTVSGVPIKGRTWYVYLFDTEKEAEFCEASYLMPVSEAHFANQLFHKGSYLILDVVDSWADAEGFKDLLLESIKNRQYF